MRLHKFEEESAVSIIERYAFSFSEIEEIYFPKSLIELKVLGCSDTEKLKRIIISPFNGQFIFKEDKYLIGKCNQNNAEFDKLLFVRRDIKEISIPPKIKIIGSYSFDYSKIEEISIPPKIKIIGSYSFDYSKIEEISIPQSVTKICENAFSK